MRHCSCTILRLYATAAVRHCGCTPLRVDATAAVRHCSCSPLLLFATAAVHYNGCVPFQLYDTAAARHCGCTSLQLFAVRMHAAAALPHRAKTLTRCGLPPGRMALITSDCGQIKKSHRPSKTVCLPGAGWLRTCGAPSQPVSTAMCTKSSSPLLVLFSSATLLHHSPPASQAVLRTKQCYVPSSADVPSSATYQAVLRTKQCRRTTTR